MLTLTADIVAAHLSHNQVAGAELPTLIRSVFDALSKAAEPLAAEQARPEPAVSVRASIRPDYLVCLEDGAKLKMLKRYLRTRYDMSPEDYRRKWGLPADYPMVAPNYAETRRSLAHKIGLGRKPAAEPAADTAAPRKRLGIAAAKQAAQQHLGTSDSGKA
jgi:predicted transcriptional regulator